MTNHATNPGRPAFGRRLAGVAAAALLLAGTACELDLDNPNSPSESQVIDDPNGIMAVAVGMQGQFAETIDDYMVVNSLVTDEWGTRSVALISYISLFTGENFTEEFGVVYTPWLRTYLVVRSANTVLAGATDPEIGPQLGTNMRAGVSAVAYLFKAMALGYAIQLYEEIPIDITVANPVPQPRDIVLDSILDLLESADSTLATVTDDDLDEFYERVLGEGIDIRNTVAAMLARFYLMDGQYQQAIDAAERVDLSVLSVLDFPAPDRNPINNLAFGLNYVAGLESFADDAQAGDDRPGFWIDLAGDTLPANPVDTILRPILQYSDRNDPFPLYLPDEMKLIQAEAYTRLGGAGNFATAAALINEVRTQSSSPLNEPVAGLTALPPASLDSEDELLDAIAYERRYELYMQGLRWEDTRRLGTGRTVVPTLLWLPIPPQECLTNPGAGC